jgi:hypothetical protein
MRFTAELGRDLFRHRPTSSLDVVDGKAQRPRSLYESKDVNVVRAIHAVVGRRATRPWKKSDSFVMADHLRRQAGGGCGFSNVHG